jgi:hypothetical protein
MSNEPMSSRLLAQPSPAPAAPAAGSDTQRIAAALERIETAIRAEPATIGELRADLGDVVETVAALRAAVDAAGQRYTAVGALLQDLERRILRMVMLLGPAPEVAGPPAQEPERPQEEQAFLDAMGADAALPDPAAAAEAARVPTVSGVVSQLGRGGDMPAAGPEQAAGRSATAVAMLEAMVEELAAAIPAAQPTDDAADTGASEPEASFASSAAQSDQPAMPEGELLSQLARMEEMPYLPPEVGAAVIFESKAEPGDTEADEPQPASAPGSAPAPEETQSPIEPGDAATDGELDALLFEPPPTESEPAAFLLDPSAADAPQPAAPQDEAAAPAQAVTKAAEASIAGHEPPVDAPEPPEPPSAWHIDPPSPAGVKRDAAPPASWTVEPPVPAAGVLPHRPVRVAEPASDPLAALKSMSDEEKIALFE